MTRFIAKSIPILLVALLILSASAQSQEWTYPPVEISQEDREALEEASFSADAGYNELALQRYLVIATKYQGTSLEAEILRIIANLEGALNGAEARAAILQSISEKFPNSIHDYEARFTLVRQQLGRSSNLESTYTQYTLVANEISGLELSGAKQGGDLSTSRAIRQLDFERRLSLKHIYRNLYGVYGNSGRREEQLSLCRFGRDCFDFEDDGESSFAELTVYSLYDSNSSLPALEVGTRPGNIRLEALSPPPGGNIGQTVELSFSISTGDFRNALTNLRTLQVFLDGNDVTELVGLKTSYDYSLSEGADYEVTIGEVEKVLEPGNHSVTIQVAPEKNDENEVHLSSLTWSFVVYQSPLDAVILPTGRDSTLRAYKPRRNEGANPPASDERDAKFAEAREMAPVGVASNRASQY